MSEAMSPMQDPYQPAQPPRVGEVLSPPPPSVDAIAQMARQYVDSQIAEVNSELRMIYGHLNQHNESIRLLMALKGDEYRAFILEEARALGLKPSELIVKAAAEDPGADRPE